MTSPPRLEPTSPNDIRRRFTRGRVVPRGVVWFGIRSFWGHLRHFVSAAIATEDIDSRDWMTSDDPSSLATRVIEVLGGDPARASVIEALGRDLWIDYIADTGDNDEIRRSVRLYRVTEPPVRAGGQGVTARAEVLEVRYPDGPHDVEAAAVARDGAVLLVSKARSRGVQVFRVPASGWTRKAVTAQALGRLPLAPGRGVRGLVTDAALSPDGSEIAVRTYVEIFFFRLTPKDGLDPLGTACDVTGLELQGEGVAWLPDDTFLLTSEGGFGVPGTVTLVRCPDE